MNEVDRGTCESSNMSNADVWRAHTKFLHGSQSILRFIQLSIDSGDSGGKRVAPGQLPG